MHFSKWTIRLQPYQSLSYKNKVQANLEPRTYKEAFGTLLCSSTVLLVTTLEWSIHIAAHWLDSMLFSPSIYCSDSQTVRRKRWLGVPRLLWKDLKNEKKPICIEIFINSVKYINIFLILYTKWVGKCLYVSQCAANQKSLRTTDLSFPHWRSQSYTIW
jgi:hypothetical protein